jgi:regulator of protease activity HflC (stomatin/prohibitin superfamily)
VCALGCFVLAPVTNSRAVFAEAWHLALGAGVWLVALLHLTFRRLAAEERLDEEAIRRRQGERAEGIFGPEGAGEAFSAQARLVRVEKWFVPVGSLVFALGMIVLSVLMASGWGAPAVRVDVGKALAGVGAFGAIVFLTFLMSRYALGQSQEAASALVRGPASYMLFNALCSAGVAVALTLVHFGAPAVERVLAWVIIAALGLVGVEIALMFVFNLYRPRRAGREARAPYDSRLLGLLSMPKGILRSAAETLDYQFGFKVSETWFFRFLERALAPLVLFGLVTLYLLTCFVVVPPGHLSFIERFGKPRAAAGEDPKPLEPGLHMKWPWPIEVARTVPANRLQEIILGVAGEERNPDQPFLWTGMHFEDEYMLLVAAAEKFGEGPLLEEGDEVQAPPVSLLVVSVPVQFVVREGELYKYIYGYTDVAEALEAAAYRELVRYVAGVDLMRILGPDRKKAGRELQDRIQGAADEACLGVEIVFVGLHGVHPPVAVAASFEARVSAREERKAAIFEARAKAIERIPMSKAQAQETIMAARAERFAKRTRARKDATRFGMLAEAYAKAPRVFVFRWYMNALEEALKGRRLVIASPDAAGERVKINLEKKIDSTLLGVNAGSPVEGRE